MHERTQGQKHSIATPAYAGHARSNEHLYSFMCICGCLFDCNSRRNGRAVICMQSSDTKKIFKIDASGAMGWFYSQDGKWVNCMHDYDNLQGPASAHDRLDTIIYILRYIVYVISFTAIIPIFIYIHTPQYAVPSTETHRIQWVRFGVYVSLLFLEVRNDIFIFI